MTERFIQRTGIVQSCAVASGHALIELVPLPGCVGCERQRKAGFGSGHCGIDFFGLSNKTNRSLVKVSLSQHQATSLAPGDTVDVQLPAPNGQWLWLAFRVYGLPTLGLFAGAALGGVLNEFASIAFSVLGLWSGLHFGRRLAHVSQSIATLGQIRPRSTRIVSVID